MTEKILQILRDSLENERKIRQEAFSLFEKEDELKFINLTKTDIDKSTVSKEEEPKWVQDMYNFLNTDKNPTNGIYFTDGKIYHGRMNKVGSYYVCGPKSVFSPPVRDVVWYRNIENQNDEIILPVDAKSDFERKHEIVVGDDYYEAQRQYLYDAVIHGEKYANSRLKIKKK